MDFIALQAELTGDPQTLGYTGDDAGDAALLNVVNRPRNLTSMSGKQIKDAIVDADWTSRTDAQKQIILALVARDDLDPFGIDAHIFTEAMAGATGSTVADLAALRVETVSRIRELDIGFGDAISEGLVAKARAT